MGSSYRFGRFELDPATRQLRADGAQVALGARAFDVLVALVERRDRMVTKDELLELAWPGVVVEENNLQVQISTLRKVLGQQAITTIPGRGYRFAFALNPEPAPPESQAVVNPPLASAPLEAPPEPEELARGARADEHMPSTPSQPPVAHALTARRWVRWSAAATFLALALGVAFWLRQMPPVPAPLPASNALQPDRKSVAVLPFVNMSDDKGNAYFADGLHEELLTHLSMFRDLKVVSRTSVMAFRDSAKKVGEIGAELGVGILVEGSVRREGNRVRISAQVIDVGSDKHVWARTYDRELKDILSIQSELAREIARALDVTLNPQDQARLTRRTTVSLAAYDLLLRHYQMRYGSIEKRMPLLRQAVELDPQFALAWARLAMDHCAMYRGDDPAPGRLQQARDAMARALALAANDIEVRIEEATLHTCASMDFEQGAEIFTDVLRAAPNNVEARIRFAQLRARQFRYGDTIALLQQVLAIDPRNWEALGWQGEALLHLRHYEESLAVRRRATAIRPDSVDDQLDYPELEYMRTGSWDAYDQWRARLPAGIETRSHGVWLWDVRRAGARRDFARRLRLIDAAPAAVVSGLTGRLMLANLRAETLLAMGQQAQARAVARKALDDLKEKLRRRNEPTGFGPRTRAATLHAFLGEREVAFEEFEQTRDLMRAVGVGGWRNEDSERAALHALLGERELALESIRRSLQRPGGYVHAYRFNLYFFTLWDDPEFLAMVNDPASNAPLPLDWKEPGS